MSKINEAAESMVNIVRGGHDPFQTMVDAKRAIMINQKTVDMLKPYAIKEMNKQGITSVEVGEFRLTLIEGNFNIALK